MNGHAKPDTDITKSAVLKAIIEEITDVGSSGFGLAKPLRGQAERLILSLNAKEAFVHYVIAQACLITTFTLLLLAYLIPEKSTTYDIQTVQFCLGTLAIVAMTTAITQSVMMTLKHSRTVEAI